ncbi:MAG: LysE family translocator [Rhizobiales bacterium]|nr:LysE family translocator [Hyphomicrobiales bacterium]NRB14204.1 LysE family translocator [Hyphomicrobiales bacterium]
MTFDTLLIFAGILTVACIIPGPGVITLISRTLGSGWAAGAGFLLGITLGDLLFVTMVFFGMAALAETMGDLFQWIKWAGAAFLAFMAYQLLTSKGETFKIKPETAKNSTFFNISTGFLLTLGNPKPLIFYAAIMPQILDVTAFSIAEFSVILAIVAAVLISVCSAYVWVAAKATKIFTSQKMQKRLSRGSGAVLLGTATWVALRS